MIRVLIADDQALVRGGFAVLIGLADDLVVVGEAANGAEAVAMAAAQHPDVILMAIRMPVLDGLQATARILADPGPPGILAESGLPGIPAESGLPGIPAESGPPGILAESGPPGILAESGPPGIPAESGPPGIPAEPRPPRISAESGAPWVQAESGPPRTHPGPRRPRILMLTTFDLDEYVFGALRAGASGFLLKDTPPADLLNAIRIVAAGEALLSPSVTRHLIEEFVRLPGARPAGPSTLGVLTDREREVLALVARGLSNAEIGTRLYVSPATVKTHVARLLMKLIARDRAQLIIIAYESGLIRPGETD